MKRVISVLLVLIMSLSLFSCSKEGVQLKAEDIKDVVEIEMSVKNFGKMSLELYHDIAPATVENFVKLACEGFYDGTIFHRVIKDFMIQGGDDNGDGIGGSNETIYGEFSSNGFNNTLKHERGVISMARTTALNSASSQFFIVHKDYPSLNGQYAAFGKVTEGIEVVDKVAAIATDANNKPLQDVVLEYVIVTGTYDREGPDAAKNKTLDELCQKTIDVELAVKNYGTINLELYPDLAPITVENFVSLAKEGFYDGLIFHRVIEDFMIQSGDPEGTGMGGSGKNIKGEFSLNGVYNPLPHERGVISMARGSYSMDSASSQFFIVHKDTTSIDGQYAAFGKVTSGIEIVDKIAAVETNGSDKPLTDVVIDYVKIIDSNDEADNTTAATEAVTENVTTAPDAETDAKKEEDTTLPPEIM